MSKGIPKKPIDAEQVRKLAEKQWQIKEIAAFFGVSHDTIQRRFASLIEESRHAGTARLRDLQWKRAMEGSDRMILHMSKHYLGQHDKIEQEIKGSPMTQTIIHEYGGGKTILQTEHGEPDKKD